jgi:hypothetical protein
MSKFELIYLRDLCVLAEAKLEDNKEKIQNFKLDEKKQENFNKYHIHFYIGNCIFVTLEAMLAIINNFKLAPTSLQGILTSMYVPVAVCFAGYSLANILVSARKTRKITKEYDELIELNKELTLDFEETKMNLNNALIDSEEDNLENNLDNMDEYLDYLMNTALSDFSVIVNEDIKKSVEIDAQEKKLIKKIR